MFMTLNIPISLFQRLMGYTSSKRNRLISLLNAIVKVMEPILAIRISYMATTYDLLPKAHYEGHRSKQPYTIVREKTTQQGSKMRLHSFSWWASLPNTSHNRLLHNPRKRKMDINVVKWIASFLRNRYTIVKTNKHTTPKLSIDLGLPQGLLLSSYSTCRSTGR